MTPLQHSIEARGGLIKTAELHELGLDRAAIAEALSRREIQRIRQAWYANPWLPVGQSRAARIGGQLACSSAAAALGLWDPRVHRLHVCVDEHARSLRTQTSYRRRRRLDDPDTVVHWTGRDPAGTRTIVSPLRCIEQVASCESAVTALVVAESALNRRLVTTAEWMRAVERLPARTRAILRGAGSRSESGSETLFAYGMARLGVSVRQQVVIPGVGRVDALIGDRLVIELDSVAHHSDPAADRHRDALLSARGYRVLRFMYNQVVHAWPEVEAAVLAAMARGDHLAA
jgi:very-short-patch-repair endonuclease